MATLERVRENTSQFGTYLLHRKRSWSSGSCDAAVCVDSSGQRCDPAARKLLFWRQQVHVLSKGTHVSSSRASLQQSP
jgi:hypothetical protein